MNYFEISIPYLDWYDDEPESDKVIRTLKRYFKSDKNIISKNDIMNFLFKLRDNPKGEEGSNYYEIYSSAMSTMDEIEDFKFPVGMTHMTEKVMLESMQEIFSINVLTFHDL